MREMRIRYYETGQVASIQMYEGNSPDGPRKTFREDGSLESESWYKFGLLTGECLEYHPNGIVKERRVYFVGRLRGAIERYSEEGIIERRWFPDAEKEDDVAVEFYDDKGALSSSMNRHGKILRSSVPSVPPVAPTPSVSPIPSSMPSDQRRECEVSEDYRIGMEGIAKRKEAAKTPSKSNKTRQGRRFTKKSKEDNSQEQQV